ncbi:MAG: hypothetical protein IT327_26275 [Anaerolineae bacterium]|nr:hypothetical protein [Anaerolineae bacterium]
MSSSSVNKWTINHPFVKGFIGGIVANAACHLSMPFSQRFEPTPDTSLLTMIAYLGIPFVLLLVFGWGANRLLSRFGFEGLKFSEEPQAKAFPGFFAGCLVYLFVVPIIALFVSIISGKFF